MKILSTLSLDPISAAPLLSNSHSIAELLIRFLFNCIILLVLVRGLYYPSTRRRDYLFTYVLIGSVIFLLCFMLANLQLQIGFSLGLFAIFGIIRYRTNSMPIKEMTYLFVVIGLSVINALAGGAMGSWEIGLTNLLILTLVFCLEKMWTLRHESCKFIIYDNIQLIKPEKQPELIHDLETRTGLKVNRVEIGKIDFLHDTAHLSIYYYSEVNQVNHTDELDEFKRNGDD